MVRYSLCNSDNRFLEGMMDIYSKKERTDQEDVRQLMEALNIVLLFIPQTRAISVIAALLMRLSPSIFDIFAKLLGTDELKRMNLPQPTRAQVLTFFRRSPALSKAFAEEISKGRIGTLKKVYKDLVYASSVHLLQAKYGDRLSRDVITRQVKKNLAFLTDEMSSFREQLVSGDGGFIAGQMLDDTMADMHEQFERVMSRDLSDSKMRNRLVRKLKPWVKEEILRKGGLL